MIKLSSKATYFNKRVFPTVLFVFIGIFFGVGLYKYFTGQNPGAVALLAPIFFSFIGYYLLKKVIRDLMDEVYDEGNALLCRNQGKEVRIHLRDIKNVSYTITTNPHRVTLSIRYPTEFGEEISFSPQASWIPFKKNPDIIALIDRIDKARR